MFFPGETVTFIFYIPFSVDRIEYVIISYKQNGAIILEKTVTSEFEAVSETNQTKVYVTLEQRDSLLFEDNSPFTMQCNVYTKGGTRHTSWEMRSESGIQYHREVMTSGE